MELHKDGTATLTVNKTEIKLPNPTWGQAQKLKDRADRIGPTIREFLDGLKTDLSEPAQEAWDLTLQARADKDAIEAYVNVYKTLSDEDREALDEAQNNLGKNLNRFSRQLSIDWWVTTISELADTEVDGEDLPVALSTGNSINDYLDHIESEPFVYGP